MKFIGGIHNFKIENNSIAIKLPYYHRAATGLLSGAEVYLIPKISTIKNAAGQETQVKEIIISPFHPNDWYNIYEMELIMDDKPGMINSITEILKEKSINIHIQESLITNDEQNFSVNLIVDTADFKKRVGHNVDIESLMNGDLRAAFSNIGITLEKFLPCKQLRNNSIDIQLIKKTNGVDNDSLKYFYSTHNHAVQIIKKEVVIGKQIIQSLFQDTDISMEIQGTIFSDTNEKMIIVRFFNRDQHIVYFDIQHENKLGAIFHYSSLIKETSSSYNIISCYNRVENANETAHWYVLLDASHDIDKLHSLFVKLSSTVKFTQKLIVHNYSKSIELLDDHKLRQQFASKANLDAERHNRERESASEQRYQETVDQLSRIRTELSNEVNTLKKEYDESFTTFRRQQKVKDYEFKKAKKQFWTLAIILILLSSYILSKILTPADINKAYFVIAGIAGGLITLVHIIVVYVESPKLYSKLFGKRSAKIESKDDI